MANVTINQLNASTDTQLADELALYDVSTNTTKKTTIENLKNVIGVDETLENRVDDLETAVDDLETAVDTTIPNTYVPKADISQSLGTSTTKVPSLKLVKDNFDTIEDQILITDDAGAPTEDVDFTSADTTLDPTSSETVSLLSASDSWSTRLRKISQMFKNIRFLFKKLGTTDISSLGDGTVTGAINQIDDRTMLQKLSLVTNFTLKNCTGTVDGFVQIRQARNGQAGNIIGRINIDNFVRTGNNPGVTFTLPPEWTIIPSEGWGTIGFPAQFPREVLQFHASAGTRNAEIFALETFNNMANGILTFQINSSDLFLNMN